MDPHSPPPYAYVPKAEEVDPFIDKIWEELWLDTLPDSEYYPIRDDVVYPFVDGCKDYVAGACCAAHKTEHMSSIRSECYVGSQCTCTNNPLLHKYLKHVVEVFDKHMSKCMTNVMTRKILHERQN